MTSQRSGMILAIVMASLVSIGTVWAQGQRWGDTGTVSAVTLLSQTIVVEIPRDGDSLTVGAEVLPDAVLKAEGRLIDLSDIQVGDRVHIEWSRHEHGVVAHKILVLQGSTR